MNMIFCVIGSYPSTSPFRMASTARLIRSGARRFVGDRLHRRVRDRHLDARETRYGEKPLATGLLPPLLGLLESGEHPGYGTHRPRVPALAIFSTAKERIAHAELAMPDHFLVHDRGSQLELDNTAGIALLNEKPGSLSTQWAA